MRLNRLRNQRPGRRSCRYRGCRYCQVQDVFIFLQYYSIRPYVEEILAGLNGKWDRRLLRRTFGTHNAIEKGGDRFRTSGTHNAIEEGGDRFPFPAALVALQGGTGQALKGNPLVMGQLAQEGTAPGAAESRQIAGDREIISAGHPETPRTRPRATSAAPGAAASTPN